MDIYKPLDRFSHIENLDGSVSVSPLADSALGKTKCERQLGVDLATELVV